MTAVAHVFPRELAIPTKQAIQLWLVSVLLPRATVRAVSRAEFLILRPSLLLFVGPITIIAALVVFATASNVLCAKRHAAAAQHAAVAGERRGRTEPIQRKVSAPSETPVTPSPTGPPEGQPLLLIELSALIALTVADTWGFVPLSRTPFLLLLGWASLRWRRLAWRDIGLRLPPRTAQAVSVGIVAGLAIELFAVNVTTPWITSITGMPPDVSDLRALVGNAYLLVLLVVASWIMAAFGEELAFRGYLMNRFADCFGRSRIAWIASLIVVSIYFGIGHGTQGVTGIVQESLSGCWLGVLFLVTGRNLTVPIVAHGVSNTLALVLIYWNRYPGLS